MRIIPVKARPVRLAGCRMALTDYVAAFASEFRLGCKRRGVQEGPGADDCRGRRGRKHTREYKDGRIRRRNLGERARSRPGASRAEEREQVHGGQQLKS